MGEWGSIPGTRTINNYFCQFNFLEKVNQSTITGPLTTAILCMTDSLLVDMGIDTDRGIDTGVNPIHLLLIAQKYMTGTGAFAFVQCRCVNLHCLNPRSILCLCLHDMLIT